MKKLILSFSLIISFAFYAFWVSSRTQAIAQVSSQPNVELGVVPATGTKSTTTTSGKTVTNTPTKPLVKKSSGAAATIIIPGKNGTAGVTIKYVSSGSAGQNISTTPASGQNNPVAYNPTPVSTPTPTPVQTGQFKDGSYTGPAVDVYYGNVQVSATISGGRLTDVQFLQYPNDRGSSMQRSMMAMPILKSEAITAQSATVDAVSGATETSKGFVSSLGSALALAANI